MSNYLDYGYILTSVVKPDMYHNYVKMVKCVVSRKYRKLAKFFVKPNENSNTLNIGERTTLIFVRPLTITIYCPFVFDLSIRRRRCPSGQLTSLTCGTIQPVEILYRIRLLLWSNKMPLWTLLSNENRTVH